MTPEQRTVIFSGCVTPKTERLFNAAPELLEAVRGLLLFHTESPETGEDLPREDWTPGYRYAVETAERLINQIDQP